MGTPISGASHGGAVNNAAQPCVRGSICRAGTARSTHHLSRYRGCMAENVQITLPDGSSKQVAAGTTVADFVKTQIGAGLAKAALFAKLDDEELDLSRPLTHGGKLKVVTSKQPEGLDLVRHDAAHVVASVVQRLFPG